MADAIDKVLRPTVAQVVAVNAGNNDVFQLQCRNRFGQIHRLVDIQRVRATMPDIAKRAAPRAFVTHDHEGGCAFAKTLANIGATGFFADGVELVVAQDLFDFVKPRRWRASFYANPVRLF